MKKAILLLLCFMSINASTPKNILVFGGAHGWIGQRIVTLLRDLGHNPICAQSRLENRQDIIAEIARTKPHYIINAAGIIGNPTVDWCEDHKEDTIRTNVLGTINLIDVAFLHNLHVTNISTGCIYEYDEAHPMRSGIAFTEEDEPNFDGSFYSRTKIQMEKLILNYPNVLNLRVKMPISTDMDKGFVAKISKYKKLINVPNSLCILEDLLPVAVDMTLRELKGNYNFVNPGAISHNEVLDMYKQYIDPHHTYENFSIQEQDKILKARRANAELSADKLLKLYPNIPHIKDALPRLLKAIKAIDQNK
ncbi:MAG: NAD-dependent epimerase/dehydratase family protein [Candidatus Babeliales bacterium]|nr:NAD-dependent epimerase/dehydratase family protein [Candidatus Babeliales bacterium]